MHRRFIQPVPHSGVAWQTCWAGSRDRFVLTEGRQHKLLPTATSSSGMGSTLEMKFLVGKLVLYCYVGLQEGRHRVLNKTSKRLLKLVNDLDVHHGNKPEEKENSESQHPHLLTRMTRVRCVRANLITIQLQ